MTSPSLFKGSADMDYNDSGARAPASVWVFPAGVIGAFDSDKWTPLWRQSNITDATGRELRNESEVENQYISEMRANRKNFFFPLGLRKSRDKPLILHQRIPWIFIDYFFHRIQFSENEKKNKKIYFSIASHIVYKRKKCS